MQVQTQSQHKLQEQSSKHKFNLLDSIKFLRVKLNSIVEVFKCLNRNCLITMLKHLAKIVYKIKQVRKFYKSHRILKMESNLITRISFSIKTKTNNKRKLKTLNLLKNLCSHFTNLMA